MMRGLGTALSRGVAGSVVPVLVSCGAGGAVVGALALLSAAAVAGWVTVTVVVVPQPITAQAAVRSSASRAPDRGTGST